ncbi:hypothetical protein V8C86DRAFT_2776142 [Haematococcus lacustris]
MLAAAVAGWTVHSGLLGLLSGRALLEGLEGGGSWVAWAVPDKGGSRPRTCGVCEEGGGCDKCEGCERELSSEPAQGPSPPPSWGAGWAVGGSTSRPGLAEAAVGGVCGGRGVEVWGRGGRQRPVSFLSLQLRQPTPRSTHTVAPLAMVSPSPCSRRCKQQKARSCGEGSAMLYGAQDERPQLLKTPPPLCRIACRSSYSPCRAAERQKDPKMVRDKL